ncbi:hypothetical protein evm_003864 [Chilo suppressalis]|nr:hypothetical protein evm_014204 [Chilo suppressalis]RVE51463.1 hypothetical protein evm_003864 [Chilo suppressalis]
MDKSYSDLKNGTCMCCTLEIQQVQRQQQHDSNRLTLGDTTLSGNHSIPVPPPLPQPRLEAVQQVTLKIVSSSSYMLLTLLCICKLFRA